MRHATRLPPLPHLRPKLARRGRYPRLIGALVVVLAMPTPAVAWEPGVAAAIAWSGGTRTAVALARVQAAEDALAEAEWGISARFVAEPTVAYGADVEDPARIVPSLSLEVDVAWEHDVVAVLAARTTLDEAQIALADARRADTKSAFEQQIARLRADLARADAVADLAEARAELAEARAEDDAVVVAYAELDLRSAELDVAEAAAELAAAEDDLRLVGLEPWPDVHPVLFAIPPVAAVEVPAYRVLARDVARAERDLERERRFGSVRDLALAARYESRTDRYQLDASVGLDDGRPVAAVGAAYRPQQDDQWSVTIGARIVIDASTLQGATSAEVAVAAARAELEAFESRFGRLAADAARRARTAEERLAIAWGVWRAREREAATAPEGARAVTRAEAALRRDRDRLLLSWLRYVEEVDDYLALVGAGWEIVGSLE